MITCKRATIARTIEGHTIQLMPSAKAKVKRKCYNGYIIFYRFREYVISDNAMKNNFIVTRS